MKLRTILASFFITATIACHAQVNLNTSIPAPQVKGIVQVTNGGFGISTAGLTGCPAEVAGNWTVNMSNCNGGGGTIYLQAGTGISITGNGSVGNPYIVNSVGAFTINSFTGGRTVELGFAVANPVFNASYSTTPASATISNTDSINSPFTLSSPFTTATITGTFSHSSNTTTTFTLNAVGSSTQNATQQIAWLPRYFGGVGAAGATSTVTASGTTAVLSTSDVLGSAGLFSSSVGQTLGPFAPSSQKVYLLLQGGTHTFKDPNTGFPFAFNTPTAVTFINVNGVSVTMYLYESTNPLIGTYSVQVVT